MKLRKLRALRGQGSNVQQRPAAPTSVSADLDAIRGLFTEKEKELGMFSGRKTQIQGIPKQNVFFEMA